MPVATHVTLAAPAAASAQETLEQAVLWSHLKMLVQTISIDLGSVQAVFFSEVSFHIRLSLEAKGTSDNKLLIVRASQDVNGILLQLQRDFLWFSVIVFLVLFCSKEVLPSR